MKEKDLLKKRPGLVKLAAIVAVLAFFAYVNNIGHDWAYDDHEYITENAFVKSPGHIGDIFSTTYLYGVKGMQTGLYRPVTVLSYALNNAVTGLKPSFFHLVNNLLHSANSVLVLLVIAAFTGLSKTAFLAALLFAVHPVHTEAVNNVVGRAELLSFLFLMLSLLMYSFRVRKRRLYYPLSLVFFMLAMMSKEIPAVLPFFILLHVLGNCARGECKYFKRDALETAGYFAVLALYMALRSFVIARCGTVPEVLLHDNPLTGLGFLERLPTALVVVARYAVLLVFPLRLSADYSYNQIPVVGSVFSGTAVIGLALSVLFIAALVRAMRKSRTLYTGMLFMGLPFLVVSNIFFTTGTIMGERLMYIPSLGFTLILVWCLERFFASVVKHPRFAFRAVLLITVLYAGRTIARNPDWKDNTAIFTRTAETSPNSVKTSYNYALVLRGEGRLREAVDWYRRAVSIWPGHQSAWFNLGNTLSLLKQYDEAVEAYTKALEIHTGDTGTLHNLALTYKNLNRPEKAVETFERILKLRPHDSVVRINIGTVWKDFGEYDRALEVFEENVRLNPRDVGSLANIGNIYVIKGDTLRAEVYYRRSIDIDPAQPNSNNALLGLMIARNRLDEAEEKIRQMKAGNIPVKRSFLDTIMKRRTR